MSRELEAAKSHLVRIIKALDEEGFPGEDLLSYIYTLTDLVEFETDQLRPVKDRLDRLCGGIVSICTRADGTWLTGNGTLERSTVAPDRYYVDGPGGGVVAAFTLDQVGSVCTEEGGLPNISIIFT